ncbi:unnamed protein product [Schistocephalus solidus]|uniref:Uncharacterized protein n=1 Tax=Schistocephalus solidus TaxID=70667 RepID=A0A3P7DNE1_SCHSO|nr:unnamed protein product [Schistocephalus solidus]
MPDTQDDHLQTADEIIEELDRMMFDEALEPELDLDFVGSHDDEASAYIWKPIEGKRIFSHDGDHIPSIKSLFVY